MITAIAERGTVQKFILDSDFEDKALLKMFSSNILVVKFLQE